MAKQLNYYQQELKKAQDQTYGPSLPEQSGYTQRGDGTTGWDKFLSTINGYGLTQKNFSDWDWQAAQADPEWGVGLATIKRDWNNATTDEQRALLNAKANQHRNLKGYSGDTWGLGYYQVADTAKTQPAKMPSAFSYQNETMYQKALNDLVNRPDFSWSKEEDPQWSSLKKSYLREGERATANALGQASAATGGRPSTAAVTAATQAGDYYATQLNDMIPTLYQNAYNRYVQEYQQKLQDLGAMDTDRSQKWQEWYTGTQREREDAQRAEEFARQDAANEKALAQAQVDAILQAGGTPDTDLLARSGYGSIYSDALAEAVARQRSMEDEDRARETADWYAGYGDLSKVGAAGVNTAYQQALLDAQLAQIRSRLSSGSGWSGTIPAQETQTPQKAAPEAVDLSGYNIPRLIQYLRSLGAVQEDIDELVDDAQRQGLLNAGQARGLKKGNLTEY